MKYLAPFISILLLALSFPAQAQPVRDGVTIETDTTSLDSDNLLHSTLNQPAISTDSYANFNSQKPTQINKVVKTFLKIGTSLIRGDNDHYPSYSLKNAWRYPGPTVQYPETAMQYELFLNRFNKYSTN